MMLISAGGRRLTRLAVNFCVVLTLCGSGALLSRADTSSAAVEFVQQQLGSSPSRAREFWLSDAQRQTVEQILSHKFTRLRIPYWQAQGQSLWLLEERGKEQPITIGVHIKEGKLVRIQVLVYRESRGDEVRREFFTRQFEQASLTEDLQLDRSIDGIAGATLSVRALTKVARLALWLDQQLKLKQQAASAAATQ